MDVFESACCRSRIFRRRCLPRAVEINTPDAVSRLMDKFELCIQLMMTKESFQSIIDSENLFYIDIRGVSFIFFLLSYNMVPDLQSYKMMLS